MQRREAVLAGGIDDLFPEDAGLDPRAAVLGVDLDAAHLAHVEQQRSVE